MILEKYLIIWWIWAYTLFYKGVYITKKHILKCLQTLQKRAKFSTKWHYFVHLPIYNVVLTYKYMYDISVTFNCFFYLFCVHSIYLLLTKLKWQESCSHLEMHPTKKIHINASNSAIVYWCIVYDSALCVTEKTRPSGLQRKYFCQHLQTSRPEIEWLPNR